MLLVAATAGLAACGGSSVDSTDTKSLASGVGSDDGTMCVLNTQLSPGNEVRTPANTNDPTVESVASGHAQIKVRNDGTLEVKVAIRNPAGETFTAGHIHAGSPEVIGPVVVPLFSGSFTDEHFVQHAVVPVPATFDVTELCANPDAFYVNYHTTQDPVGAIRGQL
jgi:hypothetical protein